MPTSKLWKLVTLVDVTCCQSQILFFCVIFGYAYFCTSKKWGFHSIGVFLNIQIISLFTYISSITRAQCNQPLWGSWTIVTMKTTFSYGTRGCFFPGVFMPSPHLQAPIWNFTYAVIPNTGLWKSFHQFGVKCRSKGWCSETFIKQNLVCVNACLFF